MIARYMKKFIRHVGNMMQNRYKLTLNFIYLFISIYFYRRSTYWIDHDSNGIDSSSGGARPRRLTARTARWWRRRLAAAGTGRYGHRCYLPLLTRFFCTRSFCDSVPHTRDQRLVSFYKHRHRVATEMTSFCC